MQRACDVETINDFGHYYVHGWIGLPEDGHITPMVMVDMDPQKVYMSHIVHDPTATPAFRIQQAANHIFDWESLQKVATFGCPDIGMTPFHGEVVYLSSLAERQWRRGLHLERVTFHNFNHWYLRKKLPPLAITGNNYEVVWRIFNPEYLSFPQAYAKLQDGEIVGAALSRCWGLYTLPTCPHPVIAYKRWTLGYVPSVDEAILAYQFREYQDEFQQLTQIKTKAL